MSEAKQQRLDAARQRLARRRCTDGWIHAARPKDAPIGCPEVTQEGGDALQPTDRRPHPGRASPSISGRRRQARRASTAMIPVAGVPLVEGEIDLVPRYARPSLRADRITEAGLGERGDIFRKLGLARRVLDHVAWKRAAVADEGDRAALSRSAGIGLLPPAGSGAWNGQSLADRQLVQTSPSIDRQEPMVRCRAISRPRRVRSREDRLRAGGEGVAWPWHRPMRQVSVETAITRRARGRPVRRCGRRHPFRAADLVSPVRHPDSRRSDRIGRLS